MVALIGSGLLVDRHKALFAAAMLLVGLVGLVAALRTYADVIAWIRNPVVLAVKVLLLVTVTWHAIAGVHAVLLDLGLRGRAERITARVLLGLGFATVVYGLWLLATIAFWG